MTKDWQAILELERPASRDKYVQTCARLYDLGAYWRGKYYANNHPDITEALFRAKAFAYTLEHLPLTCDPRQAFAGGAETYLLNELPEQIAKDYQFFSGANAGRQQRPFQAGVDHTVFNIPMLLNEGFSGILQRIKISRKNKKLSSYRQHYLDAMEICAKAMSDFFMRFSQSVEDKELADCLKRMATEPAASFKDAIQLMWLTFVILQSQQRYHNALGRIDQYLYPFYKKDMEAGKLTRQQALDLLCHLWTKIEGFHYTTNICIGGLTPDGKDATNELSYIALEATGMVKSPSTNISARLHDKSTDQFHLACIDLIKTGVGFPAIFNDEVTVPMLVKAGIPVSHARNYCMVGCVETTIPGKQQPWGDSRFDTQLSADKIFDRIEEFNTFHQLMDAFLKQVDEDMARHAQRINSILQGYNPVQFPDPALSVLTDDCIARAKDLNDGGAHFKRFHGVGMMGLGTISDSLAAIKKLVFETHAISKTELKNALATNFKDAEPTRQMLLNRAPKYGNDDDYVDQLAVFLVKSFGEMWKKYRTCDGGRFQSCMATNVSNIPAGKIVKATPDGRHAFTPLSDAASPFFGRDTHGPTAFLNSICKPDYSDQNCTVVNMRFLPEFFANEEGRQRFLALTKEFVRKRAHEMQFNVTDNKVLLEAQKNPGEYGSLVVRVSGFSAYFTRLDESIQNDVIRRHAHSSL